MIAFLLAFAMAPSSACPMTIGVRNNGAIYSNRFHGWFHISTRTLNEDLRGGCYNDANPTPVTSVKVLLAPGAPKPRIELVFSLLAKDGWTRDRLVIKAWDGEEPAGP